MICDGLKWGDEGTLAMGAAGTVRVGGLVKYTWRIARALHLWDMRFVCGSGKCGRR